MSNTVNNENRKVKLNVIIIYFRLLPILLKTYPFLFIMSNVLSVLHGVFWGAITMYTQKFFDTAANVAQGNENIWVAFISLGALGIVHLVSQLLNGIGNLLPQVYVEKAIGKLQEGINKKMGRISPIHFEDVNMLDDINKANAGKNQAVRFVLVFSFLFTFYIPYFIFMAWYLFSLKPILALSIVIIFIPTMITQVLRTKVFAKLEDKSAPIRRQYDYYENCMVGREYFKETRLLGAFSFFMKLYKDSLKLLNKLSWKANLKTNLNELFMKILTLAGYFIVLYMLFVALINREISVGSFAAVFSSIGTLFSVMEEIVCRHFGSITQSLGTIQNYLNFMSIPEREGEDTQIDPHSDIKLKNVTFNYPLSKTSAVKNVSFTIKNGETIAIVGENGSGKSTVVRLITSLYYPNEGDVYYGSHNTKDVSDKSLYPLISGVFQRYQKYQLTLRDNISISQVDRKVDERYLDKVTAMAGLDVSHPAFYDGYDTMLSKEFDGTDLSGGQWQRVAIGRGFYRNHNIIVLDEPTAAIDPLEETKIYNRFAEISKDKTSIIVTHRLGSVKLADRIIVMDKGEVIDIGTHLELMERCRKYNEMWHAQAQYYQ